MCHRIRSNKLKLKYSVLHDTIVQNAATNAAAQVANSANDLLDQIEDTVAGPGEEDYPDEYEEKGHIISDQELAIENAVSEASSAQNMVDEVEQKEDVLVEAAEQAQAVARQAQRVATDAAQTIFTDIMSFTASAIGENDGELGEGGRFVHTLRSCINKALRALFSIFLSCSLVLRFFSFPPLIYY